MSSLPFSDITVIFRPEPWKIGPSGYIALISAPRKYSGTCGPGTLEITRLCTGRLSVSRLLEYARIAIPNTAGAANWDQSCSSVAAIAELCSLAVEFALAMALSRSGGIGDVCLQPREHARHLVSARPIRLLAHRDRHHRDQGLVRQLAAVEQVLPKDAGAQRHHDVVELDVEPVLHRFDVLEVELRIGDVAMAGDLRVERGLRRAERRGHRLAADAAPDGFDHAGQGERQHLCQVQRPGREPDQPARREFELIDTAGTLDGFGQRRVGLGAAQHRHQVGAADTVDARVVHLRHDREPPALTGVGSVDALYHPGLPQRPAAVQRQRGDVPADLGQLARARRGRAGRCGAGAGRRRNRRPRPTPDGRD